MGLDEVLGTAGKALVDMQERLEKLEAWKKAVESHPEMPPVLDAAFISKMIGVSQSQAYAVLKSERLESFQVGKSIRCTKEAWLEFMTNGGDPAAGQKTGRKAV